MRITPLDVRKQEFRRSVRGFDCDEVRAFMATLADEYEIVLVDNKQIREKVMFQDEKITEYKTMERTLRDTLMTAEKLMQETRENANKEGELIIRDAKLKATQILQECRLRTEDLRREIEGLRKEKENYLGRFKSLAESQIQFIESHRTDFKDLDDRLTGIVDSVVDGMTANVSQAEKEAHVVETIVDAMIQPENPISDDHQVEGAPEPASGGLEVDVWRSYNPTTSKQESETPTEPVAQESQMSDEGMQDDHQDQTDQQQNYQEDSVKSEDNDSDREAIEEENKEELAPEVL